MFFEIHSLCKRLLTPFSALHKRALVIKTVTHTEHPRVTLCLYVQHVFMLVRLTVGSQCPHDEGRGVSILKL